MANLFLTLTLLLQVAGPVELTCLGFIRSSMLPADVMIAGSREEGLAAYSSQGGVTYLNGPGIASLKVGEIYWVVRPEGKIRDRLTNEVVGIYYKELGTVRIEVVERESARATVLLTCAPMVKGDILQPPQSRQAVKFMGQPSNPLTTYPAEGITSSVVLGRDDLKEMATGNFCFIAVGARDGVKPGDRFTVYRPQAPFNAHDLILNATHGAPSYKQIQVGRYRGDLIDTLKRRNLPPRPMGDIVVVNVGETTSTAKIVNCIAEIHLGDIVVRR